MNMGNTSSRFWDKVNNFNNWVGKFHDSNLDRIQNYD